MPAAADARSRRWQRAAIVGVIALAAIAGVVALARPAHTTETSDAPATIAPPAAPPTDAGVVEKTSATGPSIAPSAVIDAAPALSPIDASATAAIDVIDARPIDAGHRHHPSRVKHGSENPRTVVPASATTTSTMGGTDDPCRMDEQGNVIDRHRCKE
jgi:hypothetical protein